MRTAAIAQFVPDENLEDLETTIGYKFRTRSLLADAVTYGSSNYQRFECVGDAVLNYLVTKYLFVTHPGLTPCVLTELRQATINNENFARVALKHKFHLYLREAPEPTRTKIDDFAEDIQNELNKPGLNPFGLGNLKAPKVLGDLLESVAGAVYIDSNMQDVVVWEVFKPFFQPIVTPQTMLKHPVSELVFRCLKGCKPRALKFHCHRGDSYTYVMEIHLNEKLIASATNRRKCMAKKLAAHSALEILRKEEEKHEKSFVVPKIKNTRVWPAVPEVETSHDVSRSQAIIRAVTRMLTAMLHGSCLLPP